MFHQILASSAFKGALAGFVAAVAVDLKAFDSWRSFHEFAEYDWSVAVFRWLHGIVIGAIVGSGYGYLVS